MKKFAALLLLYCLGNSSTSAVDIIIWKESAGMISVDRYTIQKIFTRKIARWPDGQSIDVFTKPLNSREHKEFVTQVLGLSPHTFQRLLDEQVFAGRSASVSEVKDDTQMIMKLEINPASIGYLNYEIFSGSKKITVIDPNSL